MFEQVLFRHKFSVKVIQKTAASKKTQKIEPF